MNTKPILVILAAGMGSRYGGLKQIDPVGAHGEAILDYSVFDAKRAGFETVVFIIKKEIEQAFQQSIGARIAKQMEVRYAYQELDKLPAGFSVPAERTKPWGTSHAVLCAADAIDAPFAVINADDYYGPQAFQEVYNYLSTQQDGALYEYCMLGYQLCNTVTENGSVARGVCTESAEGFLTDVVERTQVETYENGIHFSTDGGETWQDIAPETTVSMNLWGYTPSFLQEIKTHFPAFLEKALQENPLKAEFFLPSLVSQLLAEGKARVKVLKSADKWFGVTYRADKPLVEASIAEKTAQGTYPAPLWQD